MSPFEKIVRDVIKKWLEEFLGHEEDLQKMVEEYISEGSGYEEIPIDFCDRYADLPMLESDIIEGINEALAYLRVSVQTNWGEKSL